MSSLFTPFLVAHVLVAVLGLGSIASIALVAGTARRTGSGVDEISRQLGTLLRYSAFSLAAMLVTGVLLDLAAGGTFRRTWWFRISVLLLFGTGALHGLARRTVRTKFPEGRRRVQWIAYAMCSFIASITVLMEVRPF